MATVQPTTNRLVAGFAGVRDAVLLEAHGIGGEAEALLAEHFHTGHARIEVNRVDRKDAEVSLVDPAALSIEFGRSPDANGHGAMQGLHILGRAANL